MSFAPDRVAGQSHHQGKVGRMAGANSLVN